MSLIPLKDARSLVIDGWYCFRLNDGERWSSWTVGQLKHRGAHKGLCECCAVVFHARVWDSPNPVPVKYALPMYNWDGAVECYRIDSPMLTKSEPEIELSKDRRNTKMGLKFEELTLGNRYWYRLSNWEPDRVEEGVLVNKSVRYIDEVNLNNDNPKPIQKTIYEVSFVPKKRGGQQRFSIPEWDNGFEIVAAPEKLMRTLSVKSDTKFIAFAGSHRFKDLIKRYAEEYTKQGYEVLVPSCYYISSDEYDEELKEKLIATHACMINKSQVLLVVNPGGYIGNTTRDAIMYAHDHKKEVRYTNIRCRPEDMKIGRVYRFRVDTTLAKHYPSMSSWQTLRLANIKQFECGGNIMIDVSFEGNPGFAVSYAAWNIRVECYLDEYTEMLWAMHHNAHLPKDEDEAVHSEKEAVETVPKITTQSQQDMSNLIVSEETWCNVYRDGGDYYTMSIPIAYTNGELVKSDAIRSLLEVIDPDFKNRVKKQEADSRVLCPFGNKRFLGNIVGMIHHGVSDYNALIVSLSDEESYRYMRGLMNLYTLAMCPVYFYESGDMSIDTTEDLDAAKLKPGFSRIGFVLTGFAMKREEDNSDGS